jgi:predicted nucleotidyltransferase
VKIDIGQLSEVLAAEPRLVLATLFGSSASGEVRPESDVDVGVLLSPSPTPLEFYDFYQRVASRLHGIDDLDLVDLSAASSILAFEALCGRRLVVKDPEQVATFASETARQYEDDMMVVEKARGRPVPC